MIEPIPGLSKATQDRLAKDWPDLGAFIEDLAAARKSERVAVIVGCAMLDGSLYRLLSAFLVDDAEVQTDLLGKEGLGGDKPLATFSARINAAFAFGLLSKGEQRALHTLRRIRNDYAHKLSAKISEDSFDSLVSNLADLVLADKKKAIEGVDASSERHATILASCIFLSVAIILRVALVGKRQAWAGLSVLNITN